MTKKAVCFCAFAGLLMAAPASAQVQVDLTPYAGVYLPVSDLIEETFVDPDLGTIDGAVSHKTGLLFGGRANFWFPSGFGLEANFAYALSDVEVSGEVGGVTGSVDLDASAWVAAGKAAYRFTPQMGAAPYYIYVKGGIAFIGHTGDAWEDVDGTTDIGGVLGIGVAIDVSEMVAISLDAEDYIYSAKFGEDPDETDSKLQNDLVLTGGLVIKLGRQ